MNSAGPETAPDDTNARSHAATGRRWYGSGLSAFKGEIWGGASAGLLRLPQRRDRAGAGPRSGCRGTRARWRRAVRTADRVPKQKRPDRDVATRAL